MTFSDEGVLMADTEHVHAWYLPDTFISIDTNPPLYSYECRGCDRVTHEPKEPDRVCRICRSWNAVPVDA